MIKNSFFIQDYWFLSIAYIAAWKLYEREHIPRRCIWHPYIQHKQGDRNYAYKLRWAENNMVL